MYRWKLDTPCLSVRWKEGLWCRFHRSWRDGKGGLLFFGILLFLYITTDISVGERVIERYMYRGSIPIFLFVPLYHPELPCTGEGGLSFSLAPTSGDVLLIFLD